MEWHSTGVRLEDVKIDDEIPDQYILAVRKMNTWLSEGLAPDSDLITRRTMLRTGAVASTTVLVGCTDAGSLDGDTSSENGDKDTLYRTPLAEQVETSDYVENVVIDFRKGIMDVYLTEKTYAGPGIGSPSVSIVSEHDEEVVDYYYPKKDADAGTHNSRLSGEKRVHEFVLYSWGSRGQYVHENLKNVESRIRIEILSPQYKEILDTLYLDLSTGIEINGVCTSPGRYYHHPDDVYDETLGRPVQNWNFLDSPTPGIVELRVRCQNTGQYPAKFEGCMFEGDDRYKELYRGTEGVYFQSVGLDTDGAQIPAILPGETGDVIISFDPAQRALEPPMPIAGEKYEVTVYLKFRRTGSPVGIPLQVELGSSIHHEESVQGDGYAVWYDSTEVSLEGEDATTKQCPPD